MKFTLVYPILLCILAIRGENICPVSGQDIDSTCPKNCSQFGTRVYGETSAFNCTIEGSEYIKRYKSFKPAFFQPDTTLIFEAPTLLNIELYRQKDPYRNFADNPSLKINFLIPKGEEPKGQHDILLPEAILMTFSSILDDIYTDWYYYHCPKQWIFRFHDYVPPSTYDALNPRNISFDCLHGLNGTAKNQLKVYNITLGTIRGQSAVYIVTVNVVADLLDEAHWQTVIAVHVDENRHTVHVVFQKLLKSHVYGYVVELAKADTVVQSKKIPAMDNTVLFKDVPAGRYFVKVSVVSKMCPTEAACMSTNSYVIKMPGPTDFGVDHMKIVVMVLGCLLGVLFVLLLFGWIWMRLHKNKEKPVQGWIIHPFHHGTAEFDAVKKFMESLHGTCHCSIQEFMPEEWNTSTKKETLVQWCENILEKRLKCVLIIPCKREYTENTDCSYNNYYSYAIKKVKEKRVSQNLKIVSVMFPFSQCQLLSVLRDSKVYHIMDEFADVCTEIGNLDPLKSANVPLLSYKEETVQALNNAIEKVVVDERNSQTVPKYIESSGAVNNNKSKEMRDSLQHSHKSSMSQAHVLPPESNNTYETYRQMASMMNISSSEEESDHDESGNDYVPHKNMCVHDDNNDNITLINSPTKNMHYPKHEETILNIDYIPHDTVCVDKDDNDHATQTLSSTQTKDGQNMHCPQHVKPTTNNGYVPNDTACTQNLSPSLAKDGQNMHCPLHAKTTMNNGYVPHDTVCVGEDDNDHSAQDEQKIYYPDYVKTTVDDYVPHETLEMSDGIVKPKVYRYPKSGGHVKHIDNGDWAEIPMNSFLNQKGHEGLEDRTDSGIASFNPNLTDSEWVECKKVLSAYEFQRHLEPSCTQPSNGGPINDMIENVNFQGDTVYNGINSDMPGLGFYTPLKRVGVLKSARSSIPCQYIYTIIET